VAGLPIPAGPGFWAHFPDRHSILARPFLRPSHIREPRVRLSPTWHILTSAQRQVHACTYECSAKADSDAAAPDGCATTPPRSATSSHSSFCSPGCERILHLALGAAGVRPCGAEVADLERLLTSRSLASGARLPSFPSTRNHPTRSRGSRSRKGEPFSVSFAAARLESLPARSSARRGACNGVRASIPLARTPWAARPRGAHCRHISPRDQRSAISLVDLRPTASSAPRRESLDVARRRRCPWSRPSIQPCAEPRNPRPPCAQSIHLLTGCLSSSRRSQISLGRLVFEAASLRIWAAGIETRRASSRKRKIPPVR